MQYSRDIYFGLYKRKVFYEDILTQFDAEDCIGQNSIVTSSNYSFNSKSSKLDLNFI